MEATRTIPIVFAAAPDPVRCGLVASPGPAWRERDRLERPGPQEHGKRLELLRELCQAYRASCSSPDRRRRGDSALSRRRRRRHSGLGSSCWCRISTPSRILADALTGGRRRPRRGALVTGSPLLNGEVGAVIEPSPRRSVCPPPPHAFPDGIFAEAGGLVYYGPNRLAQYRRAAPSRQDPHRSQPGRTPVEQPTVFDFVNQSHDGPDPRADHPVGATSSSDRVIG